MQCCCFNSKSYQSKCWDVQILLQLVSHNLIHADVQSPTDDAVVGIVLLLFSFFQQLIP